MLFFMFFVIPVLTQRGIPDNFNHLITLTSHVGVAKLVIALACHAGDRGFEPRLSRRKRVLTL